MTATNENAISPNLEKVIRGLSICQPYGQCENEDCPYYENNNCLERLQTDALHLLKAQEARVMTICEIQSFDGAVYVDEPNKPVCLKMLYCYEVGQRTYGHGYTFVDSDGDKVFYSAQGFGTKWRCWTARPTDEQRKAVKWDE